MPNINVDIENYEFVDSCSRRELDNLIEYLDHEGYLDDFKRNKTYVDENQLISDVEWYRCVEKLSRGKVQLSVEDEQLIKSIADKVV